MIAVALCLKFLQGHFKRKPSGHAKSPDKQKTLEQNRLTELKDFAIFKSQPPGTRIICTYETMGEGVCKSNTTCRVAIFDTPSRSGST